MQSVGEMYDSPNAMPGYEPPEKRVQINLRIPKSLKEQLDGLVLVWKAIASARRDDPDDVDLTHVCTVLLKNAAVPAWDEIGGRPTTPEGWEATLKRVGQPVTK